ncbi:MAG: YgjP-like metallopeptidase domain-containing protein [Candidatus Melainabacteria bacterium]
MHVEVTETVGKKRATAVARGGIIHVEVPRHWPRPTKQEAIEELAERVRRQEAKNHQLLSGLDDPTLTRITLRTVPELKRYLNQLNNETFRYPAGSLKNVRIGQARYTRLAQMNVKTRVMTVSRFCLNDVPEAALRYLLLHELAHLQEISHNRYFWSLVRQFVPDYKHQSKVIQAFHQRAVALAEREDRLDAVEALPQILPIQEPETPVALIQGNTAIQPQKVQQPEPDFLERLVAAFQQLRLF